MKRYVSITLTFLTIFVLGACTPEGISDAIDDCQNDPECFNVVDEAITEELEARGINGGRMTEEEIVAVQELLSAQYIDSATLQSQELYELLQMYLNAAMMANPTQVDDINAVESDLRNLYERDEFVNELFNLEEINPDLAQLFIYDGAQFFLYKTGATTFRYEVQAETIFTLTINTNLGNVYLSDDLINTNPDVMEDLLDGTIAYDSVNLKRDGDIVYYDFFYDGHIVGALDLSTNERYELMLYDFGFDIVFYEPTYSFSRHYNTTFIGTVQDFLNTAVLDNSYTVEELEVLTRLTELLTDRTINYTIDFTQNN